MPVHSAPAAAIACVTVLLSACGSDSTGSGPDHTPPTVEITGPAAGAVSGTVVIGVTASDDHRVAQVRFKVNGGLVAGVDSVAPYSYSWDTSTFGPGIYDWQAVATDAAGNTTTSAAVRYTL
jgi:hypothetical protein